MHAQDRFLHNWFERIRSRQITLPRFQRHVAWGHSEVSGLLTSVLRGLPSGAALLLEVGDREQFISRSMVDAPEQGERVTEQLLDGQQRLTALWRSLNDTYPDRTYLIGFDPDEHNGNEQPMAVGQARWTRNGVKYPLWVDNPSECWTRKLIPIKLLRPDDIAPEIRAWCEAAVGGNGTAKDQLIDNIITPLRTMVREFNLPYLSLPARTPKDVALDVFVKMNTSSVKLSAYDIVVALVEEEAGVSLHDYIEDLSDAVPRAAAYADLPNLVLDVVALKQDRVPSQAGYRGIDFPRMVREWDSVIEGVRGMTRFLEEQSVFDGQRLPTYTAIPVLAALMECLPQAPDRLGQTRLLLRKYFWRAALTGRYEQSSASGALQDFRALRATLQQGVDEAQIPMFNEDLYPVPNAEQLLLADWPKRKSIVGRGLLALQLKCGAEDLADGVPASVHSILGREYHHLFPAALLEEAQTPDRQIFSAMNCALISWRTNRALGRQDPLAYLRARALNGPLGEEDLIRRLKTHLIPFAPLNVAFAEDAPDARAERIRLAYEAFMRSRAEILSRAAQLACQGRVLTHHDILP
jgi:hypothetical protein